MSTDNEKIKQQISIIQKLINLYQQWLLLISKEQAISIIHWTGTSRDSTRFEAIDNAHKMAKNYDGTPKYTKSELGYFCAYNRLYTGEGNVHIARRDTEWGQACKRYKGREIDLCLTGMPGERPSEAQMEALKSDLCFLRANGIIKKKIRAHSYFYPTQCPGPFLTDWIKEYNKGQ